MATTNTLRSTVCTVLCLLLASKSSGSGMREEEIVSKGFLPSLRAYCSTFTIGQVKSRTAISAIEDPQARKAYENELAKAHQVLKDFALFIKYVRKPDFSVHDKVECLVLTSNLKDKILRRGHVAIGNVELSCALSIVAAGIFFDLYSDADEATKITALRAVDESREFSSTLVRAALAADLFAPSPGKDNAALGDEVVRIAFGEKRPHQELADNEPALLDALARDLQSRLNRGRLVDQLDDPDPKWLVWDMMWSVRLQALCRLSLHLPVFRRNQAGAAQRDFMQFEAAFSNNLSELQQYVLLTSSRSKSSDIQRNSSILFEIQRHVKDRGAGIVDMISSRLGDSGVNTH